MHIGYPQNICKTAQIRYHDVMTTKKKKRVKGVNIAVSPKAHRKMSRRVLISNPKRDLRGEINVLNGLPAEE